MTRHVPTPASPPPAGARPQGLQQRLRAAQVVRNTAVGGLQQGLAIGLGFVLLPFMLARMGTERYGYLMMVQIFSVSGVLAFADAGLTSGATRFMAAHYARGDYAGVRRVLATSVTLLAAIGAAIGIGVVAFTELVFFRMFEVAPASAEMVRVALYVYAATLALHLPLQAIKGFYAAVQEIITLKAWETITRVLYAAAVVAVLLRTGDVLPVVLAEQAVVLGVAGVFVVRAAVRHRGTFTLGPREASRGTVTEIGGFSLHAFVNYVTTYGVYQKVPDLLIGSLLGARALAYFAVVSKLPRMFKTLSASANGAAAPLAAALEGLADREKLGSLVLRGARYSYLLLTPLVLFVVVFADEILRLWVGAAYVRLTGLQRAFLLWQYLMFLVLYTNATITRTAQYAALLPYSLAANALFLAVAIATMPAWGLWAVVAGFLASLLVLLAGSFRAQQAAHRMPLRDLARTVLAMPVVYSGVVATGLFTALKLVLPPLQLYTLPVVFAGAYAAHLALMYRLGLGEGERREVGEILRRATGQRSGATAEATP